MEELGVIIYTGTTPSYRSGSYDSLAVGPRWLFGVSESFLTFMHTYIIECGFIIVITDEKTPHRRRPPRTIGSGPPKKEEVGCVLHACARDRGGVVKSDFEPRDLSRQGLR